jgi:DNA-binding transcriptional MerR regulator
MTETRYYTIGPVATRLGVQRWWLAYLIERGDVPGPSLQVPGRRLFSEADVEQIQQALVKRPRIQPTSKASTPRHEMGIAR